MPELRPSRCAVCGKPARVVAASAYGAISYAFCDECLEKGLEPYANVVDYIACAGHFPEEINEMYRADIRRMLPLWGKTEEQFIRDVEAAIKDLSTCDFQASEPCDTCKHYLGGGQCRINLERECAEGEHEAWEPASVSSGKERIFIDLTKGNNERWVDI